MGVIRGALCGSGNVQESVAFLRDIWYNLSKFRGRESGFIIAMVTSMLCPFCGRENPDGSKVCVSCGQSVGRETPAGEAPVQEAPVQEVPAQPVQFDGNFAQPVVKAAKKVMSKKALAILWSSITASVAACAVLVVVFFEPLSALFSKNNKEETPANQSVTDSVVDTITGGYGTILKALQSGRDTLQGGDMSVKFTVNDEVLSLVEQQLANNSGMNLDLDWINRTTFNVGVDTQDDLTQVLMNIKIGDTKLADMLAIVDMAAGKGYAAFPFLSSKYLGVELDTAAFDQAQLLLNNGGYGELIAVLPSEQDLNQLLKTYTKTALKALGDAKRGTKTVSISGIEQKLTTMELVVTEKALSNASKKVLTEIKKDTMVADFIKDLAEAYIAQEGINDADPNELYDEFVATIDESLADMDMYEPSDEVLFTVLSYVNEANEFVGGTVTVDGEEVASYVMVEQAEKFAVEYKVEDLVVNGEGTVNNGVYNVEFSILYRGTKFATLKVVDYSATEERVSGKLVFAPSEELLSLFGMNSAVGSMISLTNLQLEFLFDVTNTSFAYDVNVCNGGSVLVGVSLSLNAREAANIQVPDASEVYTEDQMNEYLQTVDITALLNALNEIGISTDYLTQLFY